MKKSIKSIVAATLSIFAIAFSLIKLAIHFQPNIVIDKSTKIYNTSTPSYEDSEERLNSKTQPNPDFTQQEDPVLKEDNSNPKIEDNSPKRTLGLAVKPRIVEKKDSENQQNIREEEKDSPSSEPEYERKRHRPNLTKEDISDLENLSKEMDQKISQKKEKTENEKKKINDKDIKKERKDKIKKNMNDLLEEMDDIIDE